MIPGCPTAELLDVAHVIMKTLKSVKGKILEQYLFHKFCSTKIGALIEVTNFLLLYMQHLNSNFNLRKTKSTLLQIVRHLIVAHFIFFVSYRRPKLRTY